MKYDNYLKQEFIIDYDDTGVENYSVLLYFDGTMTKVTGEFNDTYVVESYLGKACNYANRVDNRALVGVYKKQGWNNYLFVSNRNDFIIFHPMYSDDFVGECVHVENYYFNTMAQGVSSPYQALGLSSWSFYSNDFETFDYIPYTFDLKDNRNALVDYNNFESIETISIRGENTSFFTQYLSYESNSQTASNLFISFGNIYKTIYNDGYSVGVSAGYTSGRVDGYDAGYTAGKNANGNITAQDANAFSYIGSAFGVLPTLMNIEILPNITLGLAFSIPLVFVLIMTIFKLVRK